jgi:hypothetical protein
MFCFIFFISMTNKYFANNVYYFLNSIISASATLFSVFLQSQVASHAAAGALLFVQLVSLGQTPQAKADAIMGVTASLLAEKAQIQVRFPLTYGILDGVIMLLNQMLEQIV